MRTVYLPALERSVTLGAYVRAVRTAIAHPDQEFSTSLNGWWPALGSEIRRQFRAAIHDRINAGIPYASRGR